MDRSRPFRRLLPAVGILSAAGFAGCASAPAYRPVVTSQAPSHPVAAADPSADSALPPATPPPGPPSAPPSTVPVAPVMDAPPLSLMPAPPSQSVSEPGASGGPALAAPAPSGVQPYLSAPMGVLQTPLAAPPAPVAAPTDNGPPLAAPQLPADAAPSAAASPSVSVNIDAATGAGSAPAAAPQKPQPAKKSTSKKPADPPLSPLARLRQRFHSFVHPDPKKDSEQKSALTDPQGSATQIARPVSGYRVPLPTAEVAVKVSTPPVHGLYASDDVDNTRPIVSDVNTARVEPTPQQAQEISQAPIRSAAAATKPAADTEIEQWPYSAPATTTAHPNPETADSTKDFTAISAEEYRASVAKIEQASGLTSTELSIRPATASPPPAQPDDSGPPQASFVVGSAPPATAAPPVAAPPAEAICVAVPAVAVRDPAEGEKPTMIVIPQAAPRAPVMVVIPQASPRPTADPPAQPAQSSSPEGSHESAGAGAGESIRDLSSSAPSSAALWSPPSQRPAIEPISGSSEVSVPNVSPSSNSGGSNPVDTSANAGPTFNGATFNPGWTLPPAIVQDTRSAPGVVFAAPQYPVYPQVTSGRYAQPAWMRARLNSSGNASPNGNAVQAPAQPAATVLSPSLTAPQTLSSR
jgi:hypothetical protein